MMAVKIGGQELTPQARVKRRIVTGATVSGSSAPPAKGQLYPRK